MVVAKSSSTQKINLAFQSWQRTDQLILNILFSSLIESIIGHIIKARISRDLWVSLETMFSSHSQAKKFQVHFQLTNLTLENQTIFEYFTKVKSLADMLTATRTPLSDKELMTYLLNGLGSAYESFVTSITTRSDHISSHELYHILLIHESWLNHHSSNITFNPPFEPFVNITISPPTHHLNYQST